MPHHNFIGCGTGKKKKRNKNNHRKKKKSWDVNKTAAEYVAIRLMINQPPILHANLVYDKGIVSAYKFYLFRNAVRVSFCEL